MHPLKKNQPGPVFLGISIADKKLACKIIKSYDIYQLINKVPKQFYL